MFSQASLICSNTCSRWNDCDCDTCGRWQCLELHNHDAFMIHYMSELKFTIRHCKHPGTKTRTIIHLREPRTQHIQPVMKSVLTIGSYGLSFCVWVHWKEWCIKTDILFCNDAKEVYPSMVHSRYIPGREWCTVPTSILLINNSCSRRASSN